SGTRDPYSLAPHRRSSAGSTLHQIKAQAEHAKRLRLSVRIDVPGTHKEPEMATMPAGARGRSQTDSCMPPDGRLCRLGIRVRVKDLPRRTRFYEPPMI